VDQQKYLCAVYVTYTSNEMEACAQAQGPSMPVPCTTTSTGTLSLVPVVRALLVRVVDPYLKNPVVLENKHMFVCALFSRD
jgi:hypothetical protein